MDKPVVAQYKPYRVNVEAGEHYYWCSCGRSKSQPFCDGSHQDTDLLPVKYTASETRAVLFCGCKHSQSGVLCDGSHNNLSDDYAEDERSVEELLSTTVDVAFDEHGRAQLDGDCYVQQPAGLEWSRLGKPELGEPELGELAIARVITAADNARFLAQYLVRLEAASSEVLQYPDVDVVVFVTNGEGRVDVCGRQFPVTPRSGVHIRAGEAFALHRDSRQALHGMLTVCPGSGELQVCEAMPDNFDDAYPERLVSYDESKRVSMADRFYQVLVGEGVGSAQVTQFIGQVPCSKAAPHRHLYEEAIVILSARGTMWTETRRASVKAGDLIFLPAEQEHSLQCSDESGMALAGHFYPSGSPSINY